MATAVVLPHVFDDLAPERAVLEPLGIAVIDATGLDAQATLNLAAGADALLVQTPVRADAALIARLARCRVIGAYGVGYDHIDVAAAASRGIQVVHVPDYGTEEVAEHTLAIVLACLRGLPRLSAGVAAGRWDYMDAGPLHRISGRTLGIVGLGRIGGRVADKARAFGFRLLACDPYVPAEAFAARGAEPRTLEALLAESDVVTLHTPLTPETRGLMNARAFALMKRGSVLVNAARGAVVDEAALLAALDEGRIASAGIDVLPEEPPAPDHPLRRDRRVILTPHAAWYSEESKVALKRLLAEDIARVLAGEPARCPVTPTR
ncbi:MAG TPA: C-terminal binding protein [Thermodesulfobacteriota bacterium]